MLVFVRCRAHKAEHSSTQSHPQNRLRLRPASVMVGGTTSEMDRNIVVVPGNSRATVEGHLFLRVVFLVVIILVVVIVIVPLSPMVIVIAVSSVAVRMMMGILCGIAVLGRELAAFLPLVLSLLHSLPLSPPLLLQLPLLAFLYLVCSNQRLGGGAQRFARIRKSGRSKCLRASAGGACCKAAFLGDEPWPLPYTPLSHFFESFSGAPLHVGLVRQLHPATRRLWLLAPRRGALPEEVAQSGWLERGGASSLYPGLLKQVGVLARPSCGQNRAKPKNRGPESHM